MKSEGQTRRQPPRHGFWLPGFELLWRQVAQGRVQTDSVIDLLDELCQMLLQFFQRAIRAGIDFLMGYALAQRAVAQEHLTTAGADLDLACFAADILAADGLR